MPLMKIVCDTEPNDYIEIDTDDFEMRVKDSASLGVVSLNERKMHQIADFIQKHVERPKIEYKIGDVVRHQHRMALVENNAAGDMVSLRFVGGHFNTVNKDELTPVVRWDGSFFEDDE